MAHAWMIRFLVLVGLFGAATQAFLSRSTQTKVIGSERLVSIEPLDSGEFCVTEETAPTLMAKQASPSPVPARPGDAIRAQVAARKPVSTLRDPRNAFAGLVIDPIRNEVVIAEENNFSLLVYDRMENTPPKAALSEPKRMIQGENTFLEYACSVYVDPVTGDIYGINNDTLNWMTVFDRNAKGNASPNRKLHTPHTTFGIVADEETQELLMTIQDDHAVVTFKKYAKDQDSPIRLLQGPKTLMADPHGIALDPKTGLIYVTNWGTKDRKSVV